MSDFLFPLSDGVPETAEDAERLAYNTADQVQDAMLEISGTAELQDDEASWLESLLDRMFAPILDIIHPGEKGYDSGQGRPGYAGVLQPS